MKINLISLAFILITFYSCSKDQSFELGTDTPSNSSVVTSNSRLVKFFEIDTTRIAPADTVYREFYSYDALNRIIKKRSLEIKANGDSGYFVTTNYVYNGPETMAQKLFIVEKYFSVPADVIYDTAFYNFANNKIVKDSVTSSEDYYLSQNYTYNTNYINRTFSQVDAGNGFSQTGSSKIYQTKIGNNITAQTDTFTSINTLFPADTDYSKFSATVSYVNNPNPFSPIANATRRNYLSDDLGLAGDAAPEKLITQQQYSISKWTNNGPVSVLINSQLNYTYSFRPDGYPTSATMLRVSNGNTKKTKILFVYQ